MENKNFDFTPPKELISREYLKENYGATIDYRTDFMRDRDRILYSTAFRRLAGKTQIYTTGIDDHKRNRLTHTLEVSQIARTIADALELDVNLTEAISLAHDLGHTPFGHAGEKMLHDIMIPNSQFIKNSPLKNKDITKIKSTISREIEVKDFSTDGLFGFKHNIQSARVVSILEDTYRDEKHNNIGLNLTNFTLWGIIRHSKLKYVSSESYPDYDKKLKKLLNLKNSANEAWSFEAYIVEVADDIAQWHHDLEDALRGNALHSDEILDAIEKALSASFSAEDEKMFSELKARKILDRKYISDLSHVVVNTLVTDLIKNSNKKLNQLSHEIAQKGISNKELFLDYEKHSFSLKKEEIISFSEGVQSFVIKNEIKTNVHHSRDVERMNEKGKYIIRKLFEAYYSHPQQLPDGPVMHYMVEINRYTNIDEAKETSIGKVRTQFDEELQNLTLIKKIILMRRICDHIASMTDRYAIDEYNHLYG